jgi:ssDNA-binding Zn-finger/Zn-ribbon topoisomerase 1
MLRVSQHVRFFMQTNIRYCERFPAQGGVQFCLQLISPKIHERFRVRFHVRFAANRRCDLVSHTELLPFTHSMRYGVAIWCCDLLCEQTRTRNRTPNRKYTKSHLRFGAKKKIGSDSSRTPNCRYTKSHLRFRSKSNALNRSCNQPLSGCNWCQYNDLNLKLFVGKSYIESYRKLNTYFVPNVNLYKKTYYYGQPFN